LAVGDFNGDGRLDIAAADASGFVTVQLGNGDGTFQFAGQFATGADPVALVVGDFNHDGILDLATANYPAAATHQSGTISVLLGRGDGTFGTAQAYGLPGLPLSLTAEDVNGDGILDLVTALPGTANDEVLRGRGDGTFQDAGAVAARVAPTLQVQGDFNGDGRLDDVTAIPGTPNVSVGLATGAGTFVPASQITNPVLATPLVGDVTGDGVPDVVILGQDGRILLRRGLLNDQGVFTGEFSAPILVNPAPAPGSGEDNFAARDVALVHRNGRLEIAALDAHDPLISFYAYDPATGTFTRSDGPIVPGLVPVRIAAGDLNRDGLDDLVVTAAQSNLVFVYLQAADGSFGPQPTYQHVVGVRPLAIDLVDLNSDGRLDIVVTNQSSGDVSVLLNDRTDPFATEQRFRAGTGPYGLAVNFAKDSFQYTVSISSAEQTSAVAAGDFNGDHVTDLVVLNSGPHQASVLLGDGSGGVDDPQAELSGVDGSPTGLTFDVGVDPVAIVAGQFDLNNNTNDDLAVLDRNSHQILIYLGDGAGHFGDGAGHLGQPFSIIDAGAAPTGLSLFDVNGDGKPDLLVGDASGDLLILLGNGDGTFRPPLPPSQNITLAVADLNHDGQDDFIFSDPSLNRVTVQYGSSSGPNPIGTQSTGVLAPGAVDLQDLNGDGIPDLVVANGGGDDVLVYLSQANVQFARRLSFPVGTDPVGVTIADLNGDGIPDLVVTNRGSNDVSILLGHGQGASWTLVYGPRLQTGGTGPISTLVQDINGDGIRDLLVSNSQSNTVALILGVGRGFFNDQNPVTLAVGTTPGPIVSITSPGGTRFATSNFGSNTVTVFGFNPSNDQLQTLQTIDSGGTEPVALLTGDFNRDGNPELLVADHGDHGDGVFEVLQGESTGLFVAGQPFTVPGVTNPTDLARSAVTDGLFYASTADEEIAFAFTLPFAPIPVPGGPIGPPLGSPTGEESPPTNPVSVAGTELHPVDTSAALALVPVLLPGFVFDQTTVAVNATGEAAGTTPLGGGLDLRRLAGPESGGESEDAQGDRNETGAGKEEAGSSPLMNFLLGVEDALPEAKPAEKMEDPDGNAAATSRQNIIEAVERSFSLLAESADGLTDAWYALSTLNGLETAFPDASGRVPAPPQGRLSTEPLKRGPAHFRVEVAPGFLNPEDHLAIGRGEQLDPQGQANQRSLPLPTPRPVAAKDLPPVPPVAANDEHRRRAAETPPTLLHDRSEVKESSLAGPFIATLFVSCFYQGFGSECRRERIRPSIRGQAGDEKAKRGSV
jgi:hypothetical protein